MLPEDFAPHWRDCVNEGRVDDVIGLYDESATLMPTFSPHAIRSGEAVRNYFEQLATREELSVTLHEQTLDVLKLNESVSVLSGIYSFAFKVDGTLLSFPARFTFVIDLDRETPILHHHSSQVPRTLS